MEGQRPRATGDAQYEAQRWIGAHRGVACDRQRISTARADRERALSCRSFYAPARVTRKAPGCEGALVGEDPH